LTALSDRDNELRGRQLSADDYMTKPIDFGILETIIKARLAVVARTKIWPQRTQLNDRKAEVSRRRLRRNSCRGKHWGEQKWG
jgi:DNA-binding response OmpR family regulator